MIASPRRTGRASRLALFLSLAVLAAVALPAAAQNTVIETAAGDAAAPGSQLLTPGQVAVDASGNVYVADTGHHRILKRSTTGTVSVFAGTTDVRLYGGDGGRAEAAHLDSPSGVAVDDAGNVYIADTGNHRIRKVDAMTGNISTFAGSVDSGKTEYITHVAGAPVGLGIFFGEGGFAGDGEVATSTTVRLSKPYHVAVDSSGNVYFSSEDNQRIRKVDADGIISTFVQSTRPQGVAVDSGGNVYFTDWQLNRVYQVTPSGTSTLFAGHPSGSSGTAGDGSQASSTSVRLTRPSAVAVDATGNVYIATSAYRVRKVDADGIISTFAGSLSTEGFAGDGGPAASAWLGRPDGVAAGSDGAVYISESSNNRVRKVARSGIISTIVGADARGFGGDGGPARWARLNNPRSVAVDATGNVYIADTNNHRVRKIDAATWTISTIAGTGTPGYSSGDGRATAAQLNYPYGVAVSATGTVYIADYANHRIRKVDGATISTIAGTGTPGPSGLSFPTAVAVDATGNVYIADFANSRIRRVDTSGTISTIRGGFGFPRGVAVDAAGNVYASDNLNHLQRSSATGTMVTTVARSYVLNPITNVYDAGASGGVDSRGRPVSAGDGSLATSTSAQFNGIWGMAVDASGNVYIADEGNHRVRRVDGTTGILSTLAGTGWAGYAGDSGAPASARLNRPYDVAVDASGNVYIADSVNSRIRRVGLPLPPVPPRPPRPGEVAAVPPPNAPPEASTALAHTTLAVGGTLRIELRDAFRDPDGDVLAYSAVSSNEAVVSAAIEGDALVLAGVADGVATATVTATDPRGLSAAQTLTAIVGSTLWLSAEGAAGTALLVEPALSAPEGGAVRLEVRLSAPRQMPTPFSWRIRADADPATADADAGEHGDASGTGTIAAGKESAVIEIDIADDADVEPAREWFVVELQSEAVPAVRSLLSVAVLEGVCDRSGAVAAALSGGGDCTAPTDIELAARRSLLLDGLGIAALEGDDLAGLAGLQALTLRGNPLETLPEGLLSAVPTLRWLRLAGNRLSALREDAFAGLAALQELDLSDNALETLPRGMLAGLEDLRWLRLTGNALQTLPDGLFAGVESLRLAHLGDNPGAPFALRVQLRRTDAAPLAPGPATIRAELAVGAPFAVEVALEAAGAELSGADGGQLAPSLAAGDTAGGAVLVTAAGPGAGRVTATVGGVPETVCNGRPCWNGIELSAGDTLMLFRMPPTVHPAPTPGPLFGHDLRLPLASLASAGDMPLRDWQASSSDPAIATVRIRGGELLVEPVAGASGNVEIAVTATDATGLSATVRFMVRVEFHWPTAGWRRVLETVQPEE